MKPLAAPPACGLLILSLMFPYLPTFGSPIEDSYRATLEKRFLQNFLPPRGGWELSNAEAAAVLGCDGKIESIVIKKPLVNKFKMAANGRDADAAVMNAIRLASPAPVPHPSLGCPLNLSIKFCVKDAKLGGYTCSVSFRTQGPGKLPPRD